MPTTCPITWGKWINMLTLDSWVYHLIVKLISDYFFFFFNIAPTQLWRISERICHSITVWICHCRVFYLHFTSPVRTTWRYQFQKNGWGDFNDWRRWNRSCNACTNSGNVRIVQKIQFEIIWRRLNEVFVCMQTDFMSYFWIQKFTYSNSNSINILKTRMWRDFFLELFHSIINREKSNCSRAVRCEFFFM